MKCLVVDDSATMRRIVVNSLKTIGYSDVVEAGDGKEALAKCDGTVEMVITDWNMPNMGGLELVKALRANPQTAKTADPDGHHAQREGRHPPGGRGRRQQLHPQAVHARRS